jgi:hypothetical protein
MEHHIEIGRDELVDVIRMCQIGSGERDSVWHPPTLTFREIVSNADCRTQIVECACEMAPDQPCATSDEHGSIREIHVCSTKAIGM